MAISRIPLPGTGMDAFLKQLQQGEENRQKQNQLAELQKYHQGDLNIRQGELGLKQREEPLNMDLLRAKVDAEKALKTWREKGGSAGGTGVGGKEQMFYQSLIAKDNPGLSPDQVYEASNVLAQGGTTLADGTKLNPLSPASRSSLDRIIKYGNTAQGLNRQGYATTTENLISGADQNAQGAINYSGLLGGAEGSAQKAIQLLGGESSPDYQQYINFTRVDVPMVAGELMRELGVNASDEQKRMYKEVVNPVSWDTNPKLAMARWNHFREMVKKVGKSVSNSPSQNKEQLNKTNKENLPNTNNNANAPSDAEVAIYNPDGSLYGWATKSVAAKFLEKHRGHYQKAIK